MQRLILLRHAEARNRASGQSDLDRGLTETGRRDAARMGRALAAAGFAPDVALVSSARRAQETWAAASAAFPQTRAETVHSLYNASPEQLARTATGAGRSQETVLVVGHNPGIHLHASALAGGAAKQLDDGFPPATAAVFRYEGGQPSLERLFRADAFGLDE